MSEVTVKEVAKEAGVSTATVSRALNNDQKVKPETKKKVEEAAKKLNYKFNEAARLLKTNKSRLIGIVAPELSNDFFTDIIERLENNFSKYNYSLLICSSRGKKEVEKEKLEMLLNRSVDGIFLIPCSIDCSYLSKISFHDTPLIFLDRLANNADFDIILSDNFLGSYNLTTALINMGYKEIGFIGGNNKITTAIERFNGYKKAIDDHKLIIEKSNIFLEGITEEAGYNIMKKIMNGKNRISAYVVENSLTHIGATTYLLEKYRMEERSDIVFASFDNPTFAPLLVHCRFAMKQDISLIVENALNLMLDRIKNKTKDTTVIKIKPVMKKY